MALAKSLSAVIVGVGARLVEIEANVGPGLPGTFIVGLGDTAIAESRDRMKTAAQNSFLAWPKTKVIVSLTPASLKKSGAQLDAAMCLAILAAARDDYDMRVRLSETLVLAELGLDGRLRPVKGVLPALLAAQEHGVATAILSPGNAQEGCLVDGVEILIAESLSDIVAWLHGQVGLDSARSTSASMAHSTPHTAQRALDMADVAGEPEAKFAAEVAAAGGHNFMLIGPPGSGKSMIAERLPTIMPPLSPAQQLEVAAIRSISDVGPPGTFYQPPFVAPHHSVTRAALLGGGAGTPLPGAVTQAHRGVLFLDEVSEIPAQILDCLRTPIEEGAVRLARARQDVTFPARFQLVLAANPCRCAAEDPALCRCSSAQRASYLNNLSGPLRDRIDMFVRTRARGAVLSAHETEPSEAIAERVAAAREKASQRWERAGVAAPTNAAVEAPRLRRHFPADEEGTALLAAHLAQGQLSQRGCDRTLRLAWTLCDLDGVDKPTLDHVARAVELHDSADLVVAA